MVDPVTVGTTLLTSILAGGASALASQGPSAPSAPEMAPPARAPIGTRSQPRSTTPTFVGDSARPQDQSNKGGATLLGQ